MARLTRYTQSVFGSTATSNQMAQYGSLAAGTPLLYSGSTITPAIVQALSNYSSGWFAAVEGAYSPAIEDQNSLDFLETYQLSYLMQLGVPEWDAGTTYYLGSLAQNGSGVIYRSLTNTNLNNALTVTASWLPITGSADIAINPGSTPTYVMTASDNGKTFFVASNNGAMQFTLPAGALNFTFTIKDSGGNVEYSNITVLQNAAETIEGLAATYTCNSNYGTWVFNCSNPNWSLI